jgi:hypothetical protein
MDERDEKFLKDLAWSEAWFPWRKKHAILVKGSERSSSEMIALVVSTLALIASAAATLGTWRQTDLMKDQLVAAERNAGLLRISEAVANACIAIQTGPIRVRKWRISRGMDGRPTKVPIVNGTEFALSIDRREAYANALQDLQYGLTNAGLYRIFSRDDLTRVFTKLIDNTRKSLDAAIDVVDDTRGELDYVRLRNIGEDCSVNISNVMWDEIGPRARKLPHALPELQPFERKFLTPIPDEPNNKP